MTGGHGGCRGCGEVTALRLIMAANNALQGRARKEHIAEVEALIAKIETKLSTLTDEGRIARLTSSLETINHHLFLLESGPTGEGPAAAVIANSTGCSSVYSSTFPYNP